MLFAEKRQRARDGGRKMRRERQVRSVDAERVETRVASEGAGALVERVKRSG